MNTVEMSYIVRYELIRIFWSSPILLTQMNPDKEREQRIFSLRDPI